MGYFHLFFQLRLFQRPELMALPGKYQPCDHLLVSTLLPGDPRALRSLLAALRRGHFGSGPDCPPYATTCHMSLTFVLLEGWHHVHVLHSPRGKGS